VSAHPTPWKVQIVGNASHVIDAVRDTVMAFDPDDAEFWQGIVTAVNSHDTMVAALEAAIAALRSGAGPEEKMNAERDGKAALVLAKTGSAPNLDPSWGGR